MISVSRLLGADSRSGDSLRYGDKASHGMSRHGAGIPTPESAAQRRPIVVWNITRTCNLRCLHCYTDSESKKYGGELTREEGFALLDDLAAFGVPSVLLSGGEPFVHPHLFDYITRAREKGLRVTISTNGTLISKERAARLNEIGVSYVGISLDGIGATNDTFRGKTGAFVEAVEGIRNCLSQGVRVGLRMTLTRHNVEDLPGIFRFIREEKIPRVCFYHLVPTGRGRKIAGDDLTQALARRAVDQIIAFSEEIRERGDATEILTVDQPADGPYLLLHLAEAGDPRAAAVEEKIRWNGGGRWGSGVGIGCVGPTGNVHPDQFWRDQILGNVREKPFSRIWEDPENDLLAGLRNRLPRLKGRCAACRFISMCGGGFRARAAYAGDPWGEDPGCYLTDAEIGREVVAQ